MEQGLGLLCLLWNPEWVLAVFSKRVLLKQINVATKKASQEINQPSSKTIL